MRVLICGQTYYPAFNGQSIFTVNLAEGLARRGHEVTVVMPSNIGRPFTNERNGVQIEAVPSIPLTLLHPDVFFAAFSGMPVRRIFKSFQPDVAHIHDHYPLSRVVLKTARQLDVKVVGTNHFMPENLVPYFPWSKRFKSGLNWALWHWMMELFNQLDTATAPSKTAAAILRKQGLNVPVYPISCGVDLDKFSPKGSLDRDTWRKKYGLDLQDVLLLFVGRVDAEKRLDVLLQALHHMNRNDIQLAIVGEGAARKDLENLSRQLNLIDRVHFTGFIPGTDLPSIIRSADIFVMPSEAELLSIATLEAMACAKPILAARAGALPELVNDGVNGYLFCPGDIIDAARYIALLVDHPQRWHAMGVASLKKVGMHSLDNTLQSYELLYDSMSSKSSQPVTRTTKKNRNIVRGRIQESIDHL
jgi:1,2-diacylglycerol 3-alpha-glucosyltransferase